MMSRTVLLADDDCDDALIFREALDEAQCDTTLIHANTGARVFILLEQSPRPDIIFLDLNMPVMNGWQCLAKLKNSEAYKDIPVVMYTTSSNPRDYEIASDLNAHGFITKPSNPKVLSKIIKTVICSLGTAELKQTLRDAYLLTMNKKE
jgi:CheY-like chemotaxis protein